MPHDPQDVQELFLRLVELPPADRPAALDRECGSDVALRQRIEGLLKAHEESDSLLDRPSDRFDATVLSEADNGANLEAAEDVAGDRLPSGGSKRSCSPGTAETHIREESIVGAVIADRYTMVQRIGEGGMGEVWMAKQTSPVKRKVALKLIKMGMDSKAVLARFDQERQALALMDHPNIAKVLDGGITPTGQPFFVMELVNGLPLNKFCDEARLDTNGRLELFVAICQAVQHAHQKGIVHRDLKPANILVTLIDGRPVPKVIDFGVAKATSGKLTDESLSTQFGAVVGTLEYMSPEQAGFSGEDIDTRADIYSLGVILYELLTGLRPIDAQRLKKAALTEMIRIVREEEPSRPSTRLSTDASLPSMAALRQTDPKKLMALLRGELDWVVMKCLEKHRDRRYETANALARDVQRYLADEAVEARPPNARYRLNKFLKRNKGSVIAASLILLAVAAGILGTTVGLIRAERALIESREKTARMTYERAQALCEDGEADLGLLWMARSLELTPPEAEGLNLAIRASINLWGQQLNTVRSDTRDRQRGLVNDIAVSPDGLSLLLVDYSGIARLCEKSTGKLRFDLALETGAAAAGSFCYRGMFSPDGRFVAVTRSDQRARVWNAVTGELVGKPLIHEEPVTGVSFVPTGNVLVTTAGNKIHFWNVERGVEEGEPLTSEQGNLGVEVSANGLHVLAWSGGQVVVWDRESRNRLFSLDGIDFDVYHASFSPDGRLVLASGRPKLGSGSLPMAAQFWEVATGRPVGNKMRWENKWTAGDSFNRNCFRPDGRLVVTGGNPLRMWHVPSGKPLGAVASMFGDRWPVFQPDGKVLVAFDSYFGQFLDVAPVLEPVPVLPKFEGSDQSFADSFVMSPDERTVIVAYYHQEKRRLFFRLYELSTGKAVGELLEKEGYQVDNGFMPLPVFSSDGRSVATVVGKNACQILDTATGRERVPRIAMDSPIRAIAFSPDGQLLASGDFNGVVRFWSTATWQPVGPPMVHKHRINRICFSPDGLKLLVAGGNKRSINGEARLWDVASGQPLGPDLEINGAVQDAAFSPDGTTFATGAFQLNLWDAVTSSKIWTAPSQSLTNQLAFTPDGRKLLAQHLEERAARVYDARTGEPITPLLRHEGEVVSTSLSPDGRLVLTSGADNKTRLWDTSLGLPLGPVMADSTNGKASFSPDGRSVLLIGEASSLVRWEIPAPLEETPERIRLTIEAATRKSMDPFGAIHSLSPTLELDAVTKRPKFTADSFEPIGKRLQKLGGPTGSFRR